MTGLSSSDGISLDVPGTRPSLRSLARVRSGSLKVGLALLLGMVVLSTAATIVGGDPTDQDLASALAPPGSDHVLGADGLGRDVLAWVGAGIRTSLQVGFGVVLLSAVFGCTVGIAAGLLGGWVDAALMRLADIQLSLPALPVFIAASVVLSNSMTSLVILLAVFGWVPYARLSRTRVLSERQRGYVSAARLAGRRRSAIAVVHLLPGLSTEISILGSLQAGTALVWESSLSFLGLGLQPPYISLGFLMSAGRQVLNEAWWVAVFPGAALALLVIAFNLVGDGVRDLFSNPASVGGQ
jgi:peptide/nickel transport system permease protein